MKIRFVLLLTSTWLLGACAVIPADRGSAQSIELLRSRSGVAASVKLDAMHASEADSLKDMLTQPLDADAAVRVALVSSPRLQALYAQLGLAQADVYDASRLSNPSLGFMRLTGDGGTRTTWTLTQGFMELLFIHYRSALSHSASLQAKQRLAQSVLNLEAEVRTAYYRYVAASLVAQLHEQAQLATQVSADYAQSLFDAGNISELQLSRERAAGSEARVALHVSQSDRLQRRGELLTMMGVSASTSGIAFVERLDIPVAQSLDLPGLQQWAEQQRVDLLLTREQLSMYDRARTHARRWFWLDGAEVQAERERETDGARLNGIGGSVGLPLFNQGGGARLRAQAQWEAAQAELTALRLSIGNELAVQVESLQRARAAVNEYRETLMPLRERIVELSQQQQNFMLIGTFELLSAKHELLQAYQDYLNATGEYWIRHVELARTVGGRLPDAAGDASYGISVGVDALPAAAAESARATGAVDEHAGHSHADMNSEETP
ncbi:MAG: TolC family protein [Steroidobacteraceae bacterium]